MAVTLAQAEALTQDKLVKGIIQTIRKTSGLMDNLPFIDLVGNALAMNLEDGTSSIDLPPFRVPNATWTEKTVGTTPVSYSLSILGEDADVDRFLEKTRGNMTDLMASQIKIKSRNMAWAYERESVYGLASGTAGFNGLHYFCSLYTAQHLHASVTADTVGAPLTTSLLDQACDLVRAGSKPSCILMNRNIRRRLSEYLRTVGSLNQTRDEFGRYWLNWQDIPIYTTDWILQTEGIATALYNAPTTGATSSVFVLYFGDGDGIVGMQNGGITKEYWEKLEAKDAARTRIKWYCGLALYNPLAIARIDGVTDAAVVA